MSKIYEKLRGKLHVEIFGAFPESVLNAAAISAIELWELECVNENTLRLSLYESDLDAFKEITRRCSCELKLLSTEGGSKDRRTVRRRLTLLIFALITGALLILSSLFIWEIDVRGNEKLSRGEVLRALSQCGVECGTYWPNMSADLVRSGMVRLLPELGWMTVNVSGSRAVVLITERQEKPEIYAEKTAADIIAAKTGIIKRMSVLNGKAAAVPGQAVMDGELLVSGAMDSITNGTRYVRARAAVTADTWYELCAVRPMEEQLKESTVFSRSRFAVVFGKRRINLYIDSGKTIDECDKIIHEYKLGFDGLFALPVKLLREELRYYKTETGGDLDTGGMEQRLDAYLKEQVKGEVLQQSFTEGGAGGLYVLTLRAHCLEDIAKTLDY